MKGKTRWDGLLLALLAYCVASFTHFSHNAIYIDQYPILPEWITPFGVYSTWLVETGVGIAGYLLYSRGFRRIGLALVAIHASLAFDGLAHYLVAPVWAHTLAMNL